MENVKRFSDEAAERQALNMQLEHSQTMMQQQVLYMQDDWKREQDLVV